MNDLQAISAPLTMEDKYRNMLADRLKDYAKFTNTPDGAVLPGAGPLFYNPFFQECLSGNIIVFFGYFNNSVPKKQYIISNGFELGISPQKFYALQIPKEYFEDDSIYEYLTDFAMRVYKCEIVLAS